jgi:uncharacterized protein YndB with AHSA1/START domain
VAVNEAYVDAPPERVFEVLEDPGSYGDWVVGSRKIRDSDATFPQVGSRFHHQLGVPPLILHDHTEVLEMERARRLVLLARARPLGVARIVLTLRSEGRGTRLRMVEEPGNRLSRLVFNRLTDRLVHVRNVKALRRLKELAER